MNQIQRMMHAAGNTPQPVNLDWAAMERDRAAERATLTGTIATAPLPPAREVASVYTWTNSGATVRTVKNLGWLLRHWREIGGFRVEPGKPKYGPFPECQLWAFDRTGNPIYSTPFASKSVLKDWLNRPVFRTAPLVWFGDITEC